MTPVEAHVHDERVMLLRRAIAVLFALVLLAGWMLATGSPAVAQSVQGDELTWRLAPGDNEHGDARPNFTYVVDPGDAITDVLIVQNASARPLPLDVYAADGFTTPSGHLDLGARDVTATGLGSWVTTEIGELSLAPGERVEVPFVLDVPDDAPPGDHTGGIVTSYGAEGPGNVRVDNRLALRIHARVSGEMTVGLAPGELTVIQPFSLNPFATPPVTLRYTLANTGNVRTFGHETATIGGPRSLGARTIGALVDEILPGSTIEREVELTGVWPLFRLNGEVTIVPEAVGGMVADPIILTVAVWSIPWGQLVLVALIVAVGVTISVRRGSRTHAADTGGSDDAATEATSSSEDASRTAPKDVSGQGDWTKTNSAASSESTT